MPIRISSRLKRPPAFRPYSTEAVSYHRKVHALPFILDPETAEGLLRPAAAFSTGSLQTFLMAFFGPWSKDLVLKKMSPVYVPTWTVEAEVELKCMKKGKAMEATVFVAGAQMSGHSHPQLATLTISSPLGVDNPPVPFQPYLLRTNWSQDVIALPYTVSPLGLPALARSILPQDCEVDETTRFDPRSIRFGMLSATPVLFPIYLAEYTHSGGRSITAAVPAGCDVSEGDKHPVFTPSEDEPSGWATRNRFERKRLFGSTSCWVYDPAPDHSSPDLPDTSMDGVVMNQALRGLATRWAYTGDWGAVGAVKDWEDTRIAAWDPAGMKRRWTYMRAGSSAIGMKGSLTLLKTAPKDGRWKVIVNIMDEREAMDDINKMLKGTYTEQTVKSDPPEVFEKGIAELQKERDLIREELQLGGEKSWVPKAARTPKR